MKKKEILARMQEKVTHGQEWMIDNIQYLTIVGSHAYGTNRTDSDYDVYGCTIPPEDYVYPGKFGCIEGFDNPVSFDQFQFSSKEGPPEKHLDVHLYNITKYFRLCFDCNPNMIDSLFVPNNCVLICSPLFKKVLEHRTLFLHRGAYHKFKGYAFSQMKKIRTKSDERRSPRRKELIEKYGYDTKFAVHLFRLLDECEQILGSGSLNLLRNKEQHKLIATGMYTLPEIEQIFKDKEQNLEKLYNASTLPYDKKENRGQVRGMLVEILSAFYGKN